MTIKKGGLGRNLSALLSHSGTNLLATKPQTEHLKLAIDCLQPGKYQPRGDVEEASLTELAQSIRTQGLLQPLIVRQIHEGRYEIIAGERRWRASKMAGLKDIPALLKQVDDETAMAIALVENLQREDLNAMDQARAMQRLIAEFSLTHQQIADLLCKSRTSVSNFVRLLSLSPEVKKLLEHGDLDMGHARALLILDEEQQNQIALLIIAKHLSVRETEKLVERVKTSKDNTELSNKQEKEMNIEQYDDILNKLTRYLHTQVRLKPGKAGKGSLVIHYENAHSLQRIIDQLIN